MRVTLFIEKSLEISILKEGNFIRAHSKSVLCFHGMEEGRVRFPVGPHFFNI